MLSVRRAKFVNEYLLDHNGSRAARAAGYSVSGARVTAHRLLTNANVKAAIALKTHELATQYEISKHAVVAELRAAVDLAKNKSDPFSMIKGWVEIARIMGFYAPEPANSAVVSENVTLKLKLESLTDEDLIAIVEGRNK